MQSIITFAILLLSQLLDNQRLKIVQNSTLHDRCIELTILCCMLSESIMSVVVFESTSNRGGVLIDIDIFTLM